MKIHSDNFSYSILLSIDGGKSIGSGFRLKYKNFNFIITANHVLFDHLSELRGEILVATCPSSPIGNGVLRLQIDLTKATIFNSDDSDIAAILVGKNEHLTEPKIPLKLEKGTHLRPATLQIKNYVTPLEQTAQYVTSVDIEATRPLSEIGVANDVYLMGYPVSLGLENSKYFDKTKPLIRKGIISGVNIDEGTFIIDCPSYQGNSGGPIIEHGEDGFFRVIGLVSQYIPYETTWYNNRERIKNVEVANSGFSVCIPFDKIISLIEKEIGTLK